MRSAALIPASLTAALCIGVAPAAARDESADAPETQVSAVLMTGALGRYSMTRESSGTSWEPDVSPHVGLMTQTTGWLVMAHALVNAVYDDQGGPRGDQKAFASGMVMLMADRPTADGAMIGLRAMLSPDPLMGPRGYPLLLATGETANGRTPLIDRQHPHDLFMELAASYSRSVSDDDGLFVYVGLPGEPAFGPPAFMHRRSGMDLPEAPISHHWLDSTHIAFGVATLGWVHGPWKFDASAFNGREPDQYRWNIETGPLSSWSGRITFNPTRSWSLQASTAKLVSPEHFEPGVDQKRWSISAMYTRQLGTVGLLSATLAWGRKALEPGPALDAWLAEASVSPDAHWTLLTRAEWVEQNELASSGVVRAVGKLSVGAIYDLPLLQHWKFGLGALASAYRIPSALAPIYGRPLSAMAFVRLKLS